MEAFLLRRRYARTWQQFVSACAGEEACGHENITGLSYSWNSGTLPPAGKGI